MHFVPISAGDYESASPPNYPKNRVVRPLSQSGRGVARSAGVRAYLRVTNEHPSPGLRQECHAFTLRTQRVPGQEKDEMGSYLTQLAFAECSRKNGRMATRNSCLLSRCRLCVPPGMCTTWLLRTVEAKASA